MYGMFIPALFPMCAFGIANMYVCEKWGLTYYYRKPPMYDEALNASAFNLLKLAPILMFIFGYWAIGNTAIFESESVERVFFNQSADPKHPVIAYDRFNHTHLCLFMVGFWMTRTFLYELVW